MIKNVESEDDEKPQNNADILADFIYEMVFEGVYSNTNDIKEECPYYD